ncbi:MAG: helical backbone metal receptor [Anaerolineae bacterium]|nr:MAG: helical backbone metal receptor [Anaerolineae bacterium]
MSLLDVEGVILAFDATPPKRVVSLVPSMTESLFDLEVGDRVVGVTDACTPPEEQQLRLQRVGGTKKPNLEAVRILRPDLVISNQEENSEDSVRALDEAGLTIWLTFPKSTLDALDLLWTIVKVFKVGDQAPRVETLARTLDWTDKATTARLSIPTFVPIWQGEKEGVGPWLMTFNYQTYANDVLAKVGGMNVFAGRDRRYPLEADLGTSEPEDPGDRDTRYPRVTIDEIIEAQPDVILLPDEPFAFDETHKSQIEEWLADTPAVQAGRVHLIDGSLLTWHGTRLAKAVAELPIYLRH